MLHIRIIKIHLIISGKFIVLSVCISEDETAMQGDAGLQSQPEATVEESETQGRHGLHSDTLSKINK